MARPDVILTSGYDHQSGVVRQWGAGDSLGVKAQVPKGFASVLDIRRPTQNRCAQFCVDEPITQPKTSGEFRCGSAGTYSSD